MVVIVGVGLIGLVVLLIVQFYLFVQIIMIDLDSNWCEIVWYFGVIDCFDSCVGDLVVEVMKLIDGIGVDCVIEVVGILVMFEMCMVFVVLGGVVVNVGVYGVKVDLYFEKLWDCNIVIMMWFVDMVSMLMLLKIVCVGCFDLKCLIIYWFLFDDVECVYDMFGCVV